MADLLVNRCSSCHEFARTGIPLSSDRDAAMSAQ